MQTKLKNHSKSIFREKRILFQETPNPPDNWVEDPHRPQNWVEQDEKPLTKAELGAQLIAAFNAVEIKTKNPGKLKNLNSFRSIMLSLAKTGAKMDRATQISLVKAYRRFFEVVAGLQNTMSAKDKEIVQKYSALALKDEAENAKTRMENLMKHISTNPYTFVTAPFAKNPPKTIGKFKKFGELLKQKNSGEIEYLREVEFRMLDLVVARIQSKGGQGHKKEYVDKAYRRLKRKIQKHPIGTIPEDISTLSSREVQDYLENQLMTEIIKIERGMPKD